MGKQENVLLLVGFSMNHDFIIFLWAKETH